MDDYPNLSTPALLETGGDLLSHPFFYDEYEADLILSSFGEENWNSEPEQWSLEAMPTEQNDPDQDNTQMDRAI